MLLRLAPPSPAAEPVAGLKPHAGRAEYTTEQLIQLDLANIAFADWYLARLSAACDVLHNAEGGRMRGTRRCD